MPATALLTPMFALAAWTAFVQVLIPIARVRAAMKGQVTVDDFTFGESRAVPPETSLPNRNYMNLLEFPVLFYVGCLVAYTATQPTPFMVQLAWAFVAARVLHSIVHLSYNKVAHRGLLFGAGNVILVTLWVVIWRHLPAA